MTRPIKTKTHPYTCVQRDGPCCRTYESSARVRPEHYFCLRLELFHKLLIFTTLNYLEIPLYAHGFVRLQRQNGVDTTLPLAADGGLSQ